MKFIRSKPLLAAVMAALLATPLTFTAPALAQNDTLTFIDGVDFDTLDPGQNRTRTAEVLVELMFNRLVRWKDTELSALVPDLAESWEVSEDGLTWTFKLKSGVLFHDGTPFDAEVVKFNIERLISKDYGTPNRALFTPITEVIVVDPTTVQFITKEPYATLLENLAENSASMSSPAAVEKYGSNYSRNPVGTGPYIFEEWAPGERVSVRRNDNYFGEKGAMERIVYRPVPEAESRVIELETGNADIVVGVPPEAADRIRSNPDLELIEAPSSFQIFMELETRKPPFDNPEIRLAINQAIDREAIVQSILGGFGQVPTSIIPEGVQSHVTLEPFKYDPDHVREVIAKHYPNGFNDEIEIWTPNGRYIKDALVAQAVQSYFNDVGLKTEFKVWEWATFLDALSLKKLGNRDAAGERALEGHVWLLGTSIPTIDWRLSRKLETNSTVGNTGWANAELDGYLNQARATFDYDERMRLYGEAQKLLWEQDPPFLYLYDQVQLIGVRKDIKNLDIFAHEILVLDKVTRE